MSELKPEYEAIRAEIVALWRNDAIHSESEYKLLTEKCQVKFRWERRIVSFLYFSTPGHSSRSPRISTGEFVAKYLHKKK